MRDRGTEAEEVALPRGTAKFKILTFLPRSLSSVRRNDPEPTAADTLNLIHAARLSKGKGTFSFIEVCARLKRSGLRIRGRLAGSCDDVTVQEIRSLVLARNLVNEIEFLGSLSESDLLGELVRADVLVHLSRIDSFPLIVLESIGCGVFPICLDLSGARAITGSYCGHVVSDPDTEKKVANFILAAELPRLKQNAQAAGSRLRGDYDWAQCVAVCEQVLASVSAMP